MYTIDLKARSLLFDALLNKEFWCYAVEHAIWIKNRVPTSALPWPRNHENTAITPHEAYTGKLPDLAMLKAFGCAATPINTKEKKPQKFD